VNASSSAVILPMCIPLGEHCEVKLDARLAREELVAHKAGFLPHTSRRASRTDDSLRSSIRATSHQLPRVSGSSWLREVTRSLG
jgi:hypothetical protein